MNAMIVRHHGATYAVTEKPVIIDGKPFVTGLPVRGFETTPGHKLWRLISGELIGVKSMYSHSASGLRKGHLLMISFA